MVHCAYDSFQLLDGCPARIDTISSYKSKLLLGCSDGSLRIYTPLSTSVSDQRLTEVCKDSYILERTVTSFSKKPLLAMQVLVSREILLSLSETITFHRLPNLETFAVITKAKAANLYSWDDRRGFLCFSRQRRVCIFRHDGGRGFVEVKEFGIPDVVKSMSWCGENVCLGIRREYVILNTSNGSLCNIFPSGRIGPPLVVSLPSGELLLGKDNIGVLVDQNGKLLQEGRICWSEAPAEVVIQGPYAIALLPKHVEIRSLRVPYPLIQTVVLHNVYHLLPSDNAIIVSLENSIYGFFPVPLGAQIVQLTASGNFEEALGLCKLLPPEDSNLRAAKESSIHIRYALYLFENESYEEAMEQFLASQVEITHVLSLYPSIVLPISTVIPQQEKLIDISSDANSSYHSTASSGATDEMECSSHSQPLESDDITALESKKMSHNTLMALIKFLQKKRHYIVGKATAEGTEEVVLDAFVSYDSGRSRKSGKACGKIAISSGAREMATILDTALLQALFLTGQSSQAMDLLKGLNYCDVRTCEEFLQHGNFFHALLELYKSNTMHRDALKLLHHLVEESKSGQSQAVLSQKFMPEMIIEYLKPLCGSDPMIVLEFSMLVLESCPTQTIELFLYGNIPADMVNSYLKQHSPSMQAKYLELMFAMNEDGISGNLQNEMIQIYLSEVVEWQRNLSGEQRWDEEADSPTRRKLLCALECITGFNPEGLLRSLPADALYEERAILLGKMNQHELALSIFVHKLHVPERALSYCDRVYESTLEQPSAKSYNNNIYVTLLQIYLNPGRTRRNFENRMSSLTFDGRSVIQKVGFGLTRLNKGGRHSRKIAEIEGAEDARMSLSSGADSGRSDGDVEDVESGMMVDQVLHLLSQRWDRINGTHALKLLPKETKLLSLVPFIEPLLRKSGEAFRDHSVMRNLRQSENVKVKEELFKERKRVVRIGSESMCCVCSKKIGSSVFAVYPKDKQTLVHFVCFRTIKPNC